jgi:hypothetical protein
MSFNIDPSISYNVFDATTGKRVARYDADKEQCISYEENLPPASSVSSVETYAAARTRQAAKPKKSSSGWSLLGPLTSSNAGASGCGSQGTMTTPPDGGFNITPSTVDASHITYDPDAGTLIISDPFLFDDLGTRLQDSAEIVIDHYIDENGETQPITFSFSGARDRTVRIIVESVPEYYHADFGDFNMDGAIDLTQLEERPDTYNLGYDPETGDNVDYFIKDPYDSNNRVPVSIGTFTLEDLTGKIDVVETEEATLIGAACVATCDATDTIRPFEYIVPPAAYDDNNGNIKAAFTLRTDPSNYTEGHKYGYVIRIRLVIE